MARPSILCKGVTAIDSSPPTTAYMRHLTGSALVQEMACRLFGAKLLPEPMLAYCQMDSWEQISVKFESEFYHFHSRKCIWNCRLPKSRTGGEELKCMLEVVGWLAICLFLCYRRVHTLTTIMLSIWWEQRQKAKFKLHKWFYFSKHGQRSLDNDYKNTFHENWFYLFISTKLSLQTQFPVHLCY